MEIRSLGRTGLRVASLCLGTMQFGWTADEAAGFAVMDRYAAAGGQFLDTADVYTRWSPGNPGGVSEEILGRWLRRRGNRAGMIIATKVRSPMSDDPNDAGLSRRHIIQACEASLRRLQTDYIDLYQAHSFDADTPIDETLRAFDDLVKSGKVRYIGASNYPAWRLMESLWAADDLRTARYDSLQPHYNLVRRAEFERELREVCGRYGIGVIPYSPLAGGFLTGKYRPGQSTTSARSAMIERRMYTDRNWRILDAVDAVATETESEPTTVAIAWLLAQPTITAPILGANSPKQLDPALAAADLRLTDDQISRLNAASAWSDA